MSETSHIRQFHCGHREHLRPETPRFLWCFKCGETGVTMDYMKCSIPTCDNESVRVIWYEHGKAVDYCGECKPLAAMDEENVRTVRWFSEMEDLDE